MLKESYIANWKNLPKNAIKFRVARPSVLSPSQSLLNDYKQNKIDWQEYEKRFRNEILNKPQSIEQLEYIKKVSKTKDIYLICYEKKYPCHRFILIDMINELKTGE